MAQETQKKAIDKKLNNDKREWKPRFKISEVITRYTDIKYNLWAVKIPDIWNDFYIIHRYLGKVAYEINKKYNVKINDLIRIHRNKLNFIICLTPFGMKV